MKIKKPKNKSMLDTMTFFSSFKGPIDPKNWEIKDERINAIKEFIPIIRKSSYDGNVLFFKLSDNIEIIRKYKSINESEKDFIYKCFGDIHIMTGMFKLEDFPKIDWINKYQEELLNKLRWDVDFYDSSYRNEISSEYIITIEPKRPFGNSYIQGDVKDIVSKYTSLYNTDDEYLQVYVQFVELVKKLVSEFPIKYKYYISNKYDIFKNKESQTFKLNPLQEKYNNSGWTIDVSEIRDSTINNVINV